MGVEEEEALAHLAVTVAGPGEGGAGARQGEAGALPLVAGEAAARGATRLTASSGSPAVAVSTCMHLPHQMSVTRNRGSSVKLCANSNMCTDGTDKEVK